MNYLLLSPFIIIILVYAVRQHSRTPIKKLADRLYKISALVSSQTSEQNSTHSARIYTILEKQLAHLQKLYPAISDTEKIKEPLNLFIKKWTREKIGESFFKQDNKFISDKNYLLDFFPYRNKWKWRTLFPLFKA